MAVEVLNPGELARLQAKAISDLFRIEVPKPGDWLLEVVERNKKEKLFNVNALVPFYTPRIHLAEGSSFPGLKRPLDPWLYDQIRAHNVDAQADWLQEGWILLDVTKRPNYDEGKQMYPDTPRFKELLASLREQGQIAVPDSCKHVRKDSRFAISPDEIDGNKAVVSEAVADILGITAEQVATPLYSTVNYIGNLDHPEFGQVNTSEWFRDRASYGRRLFGGDSGCGGLAFVLFDDVIDLSRVYRDRRGFRLQISSPSEVITW